MGRLGVLLFACACRLWGQTAYGLITGSVRDAVTFDAVPNATVTYVNLSTDASGSAKPVNGYFTFTALSPGTYRLAVMAAGYQDRTIQELELPVAGRLEVRFDLWSRSDAWHAGALRSVVMPGAHAVTSYYGPDL